MHIIAADVGGTKTHLVYAETEEPSRVLYEARYPSGEYEGFEPLLKTFINDSGKSTEQIGSLALALPGVVNDNSVRLTNLPWVIEKQSLKDTFGVKHVSFMNDFLASALGTGQLSDQDLVVLNQCTKSHIGASDDAVRVAVGAGTGLGLAWAEGGKLIGHAHDTEGGHIDFAPVDEVQIKLLRFLHKRYTHVSYERILSGTGLAALYEFCGGKLEDNINAEWINNNSVTNTIAERALSLFVQIYGAYIGNIALLFKPAGGIYITGGIAAKILKNMQSETFINAYLNKGRMSALVKQIPVYLVTNERVGVIGALSEEMKKWSKQQNDY